MSRGFVPVPAAVLRQRLTAAGFRLVHVERCFEEVYDRAHDKDPRYSVRVYSSIEQGTEGVRDCGSDAIRVVALYADSRFHYPPRTEAIFKATRVHRTGSVEAVLDRMIERAREAYGACNSHRNGSAKGRGNDA